jgi:hypothetical protein
MEEESIRKFRQEQQDSGKQTNGFYKLPLSPKQKRNRRRNKLSKKTRKANYGILRRRR